MPRTSDPPRQSPRPDRPDLSQPRVPTSGRITAGCPNRPELFPRVYVSACSGRAPHVFTKYVGTVGTVGTASNGAVFRVPTSPPQVGTCGTPRAWAGVRAGVRFSPAAPTAGNSDPDFALVNRHEFRLINDLWMYGGGGVR